MAKHSGGSSSWESSSSLKGGAERFLAHVTNHALENGFRTPDDFLRHFRPLELMEALEPAPELRKDLLVMAAGLHEKIARRKSTQSAAEDLRIALDEGVTTPADILRVFKPEDRVRFLNRAKLFAFAVEDGFYQGQRTGSEHEKAVERLLFILEAAIAEKLVSGSDVASTIGFETIAQRLPMKELRSAVEHALSLGSRGEPFTEKALFETVPLRSILSYVPVEQIWNKVVVTKILAPSELLDADGKLPAAPAPEASPSSRRGQPPPKPPTTNGKKSFIDEPSRASDLRAAESEVDNLLLENAEPSRTNASPAPEEDVRKKVVDRLASIARLPPRHAELTTAILLSIDSMYAELLEASTDAAREECIRDSFPNEQHMTQALLAIIELLDPSIDVNDPVIRDADLESLIKVVLFEERHRYEQNHPPSQRSGPASVGSNGTAVPPLPPTARRTAPPPLPRSGPPPAPSEKPR